MRSTINQDQDTVIESLKSVDGVKIARKPVFFYQGAKGMREYILRESWLKAVRIRTNQVSDTKTSVDFKLHRTNRITTSSNLFVRCNLKTSVDFKLHRTNRLLEVVILLTFVSVIFTFVGQGQFGWMQWIPPNFTLLFPFCLYFVPYLFFKPFVSEISSFLLESQSTVSRVEE